MDNDTFDYLPHKNLPTINRLDNTTYSTDYYNQIETDPSMNYDIKQKQIKFQKQKEVIKGLKRQLRLASTQGDISSLKNEIYNELSAISSNLSALAEQNKYLTQENNELKDAINKKNDVISQFEQLAESSNEKFKQMSELNDALKIELENTQKVASTAKKTKKENQTLITSLNEIKTQINEIEDNFTQKLMQKDNEIATLNAEIIQLREKNDTISKSVNEISLNNQNETEMLQAQVNCLLKEKEILMREKERDHKEIIGYRQMFSQGSDIKDCTMNVRMSRHRQEEMINLFKSKEEDYIKEITKLQNIIVDREKEVDYIKDKLLGAIHDLKLENEKLQYHIEILMNRKKEPSKENDYIY